MLRGMTPLLLWAALGAVEAPPLKLPVGWKPERPPPYPNLVAAYRNPADATLTLGMQFLGPGEDGESFARGNAHALSDMGFHVVREGDRVRGTTRDGKTALVQAYITRGTVGWVVTLAGTPAQMRALEKLFENVVGQIRGP
jgi:hypothetical protein